MDTLVTWWRLVIVLKFDDIGPHVGTTVATFVAQWPQMKDEERRQAAKTLNYLLVEHTHELKPYFEDVISLDNIPELSVAAKRVKDLRAQWSFEQRINAILKRCNSDSIALATHSIFEMKEVLSANPKELSALARGDSFDPLMGRIYRTLLETAGRDGDHVEDIRIGSFECIGIIGALDPDRFTLPAKDPAFMMFSNFQDTEEAKDFALHLVEKVLVSAFRTSNDAKQQIQLAFAIQELTKFCGFTPKLLQQGSGTVSISNKVRQRWNAFTANKQTIETVAPLLEGRYGVERIPITHFPYPIYATSSTYREWIRSWTTDLISTVLEVDETQRDIQEQEALRDAKKIFGGFRGVVTHSQDVAVAHFLLPHLVLYVMNVGDQAIRRNILLEINSVLQDQVNARGEFESDRKMLSAQVSVDVGLVDCLAKF